MSADLFCDWLAIHGVASGRARTTRGLDVTHGEAAIVLALRGRLHPSRISSRGMSAAEREVLAGIIEAAREAWPIRKLEIEPLYRDWLRSVNKVHGPTILAAHDAAIRLVAFSVGAEAINAHMDRVAAHIARLARMRDAYEAEQERARAELDATNEVIGDLLGSFGRAAA